MRNRKKAVKFEIQGKADKRHPINTSEKLKSPENVENLSKTYQPA